MKKIIFLILAGSILSGCVIVDRLTGVAALKQKNVADKQLAKIRCMELCQDGITNEKDFNAGPCISNEVIPGWACDIAHSPRTAEDNLEENQCESFRQGSTTHFIELDGNCNFIKGQ